jgi:hypothetical protein
LTVNAFDLIAARKHRSGRAPAGVTNAYDFNRDGRVTALDMAAAKANQAKSLPLDVPQAQAPSLVASIAVAPARATTLVREDQPSALPRPVLQERPGVRVH